MSGVNRQVSGSQVPDRSGFVWSADTLRIIFENSPDTILLIDSDRIIDCNRAALTMLGYENRSDLLTQSPTALSPEFQPDGRRSADKAKEVIATAFANGSHRFEWTAKRSDQSEFPAEILLTSIPYDGRYILYAVWRDISRRKAAEKKSSESGEALLTQTEVLTSILHHMGDAVIVTDTDYKYLTFNPAAERMFGTAATETKADGWSRTYGLYLPDQTTEFPSDDLPLARAIRGEETNDLEMFVRHAKAPEGVWIRVNARPLRNSNGELAGGIVVCHDTSERRKEDGFRSGQSHVLEMIARGEKLESVLESLVMLIEAQSKDMVCSVLQLSEDGKNIRHGVAPHLPEFYIQAVNGAPIGPKNGSCGTAMFLGKPVVVTDMLSDPLWEDYRALAKISGFRACWSTPIFSGTGKVLGSFAMYYPQPKAPTGSEAKLTEVATRIASIAIEHQRAEASLRASEVRFAKAFNANPNPMSLARLEDGRIIEVNDSLVELSDYARPELLGRSSFDLLWGIPTPLSDVIRQLENRGLIRDIETKIRTREGSTRVVLLSCLVVEIDGQNCILSVANDVTARKRAEEEVGLLQAISMEVALAPDLNSALEVVLRRVCQSTGWILGQAWIPSQDGTALECSTSWYGSGENLETFRLGSENTRLPAGVGLPGRVWQTKQPVWIRDVSDDTNFPRSVVAQEAGLKAAFAVPITAGEKVIAVIEFFLREPQSEDERLIKVIAAVAAQLDLAIERKRAEEQLRNTEAELAHVARVTTMGELAASIAHEVNQPLGAIVGNADICLQWLDNEKPDLTQVREAIEDIANDGHRASQVIARIRSLVKKHQPEKTRVDLSDVVQEVVDLVAHEAQRKGVTVSAELERGLPLVAADRIQLQQVLLNLVMNGMEAMTGIDGPQPVLNVKTTRFEEGVLAVVSDCGVGLDPATADLLFKPFQTTKSGGMGMGLAISRSIIEAHGGKLWAEPNRDTGASFKFTLPAINKDAG